MTISKNEGYGPVTGGWRQRIVGDGEGARRHCRPLFPPADRALLFTKAQRKKLDCVALPAEVVGYHGPPQPPTPGPHVGAFAFRPVVTAWNVPRFLLDAHTAGGLQGHLVLGMAVENGPGKWLQDWDRVDVSYIEGRMEYRLRDAAFPGVTVDVAALALSGAVGLIVHYAVRGLTKPAALVWSYGGASAACANKLDAAELDFAPERCAKDRVRWKHGRFQLVRAFDEGDSFTRQYDAVTRVLPSWQTTVQGAGPSWARAGLAEPSAFLASPDRLLAATEWCSSGDTSFCGNRVVVQRIPLKRGRSIGHVVVGMGGDILNAIRDPGRAFRAALKRNRTIAARLVTCTPDPWLDAANTMQAFATEGLWGDIAFAHGNWTWRQPYLGWRVWYAPTCLGWTDRVRTAIRNHIRLGLVRNATDPDHGALGSLFDHRIFGRDRAVCYNMNPVFLDHVRHYFDHTDDRELMREIYPVLVSIVEWHNRRLQPGNEDLYESALDVCVSDQHFYMGGQATHTSAYLLQAHHLLADVAARIGEDPEPFRERARRIRAAMQRKLWQTRVGVFAEFVDTWNHPWVHPEPALPAVNHAAEFGAAAPLQISQMLHWVEMHLQQVSARNGGRLWWPSNWHPPYSHFQPNTADNLNYALTNYLGGQAADAYEVLLAVTMLMFEGPHAGCVGTDSPGTNSGFGDVVGMWTRAVTEGLFGIRPRRQDGEVTLCPQFPATWRRASIRTPHVGYEWRGKPGRIEIAWTSPVKTAVRFRLPVCARAVTSVRGNGRTLAYDLEARSGGSWLSTTMKPAHRGRLAVTYRPSRLATLPEVNLKEGAACELPLTKYGACDCVDPQGLLRDARRTSDGRLRAIVDGAAGPGLLFLESANKACPAWRPLRVRIEPATPPPVRRWAPPEVSARRLDLWTTVDLRSVFNATVMDACDRVVEASVAHWPRPPASDIGFDYWQTHLKDFWAYTPARDKPSDAAWRAKVGSDDVAWTTDGIPFRTVGGGANIGVVTLMGGFPVRLEFPVRAPGRTLYLMLSGVTFPTQSHIPNVRVHLRYEDGHATAVDLVPPFDIGDCWCKYFDDLGATHTFHRDVRYIPRKPLERCGFENIGGRVGPAGSLDVADKHKWVTVDTEAKLIPFALRPGVELTSVAIEAVANAVIFGIMGASIARTATAIPVPP
ncbi:MAG: DUF4450 domain-containing protein [Kiritimatiellae bacterium]|nr:DUF4450 domain-containing protein [Kiritimatiellia bacterium]